MSIQELQEYIAEMHEEIERVRAEIAKKEAHRSGVEALFKNSDAEKKLLTFQV